MNRILKGVLATLLVVVVTEGLLFAFRDEATPAAAPKSGPVVVDVKAPSRAPSLPPVAQQNNVAGATAFVRFYFDAVNYSLAHLDDNLLASYTGVSCQQCTGYVLGITKWKQGGAHLEGGLTVPLELAIGPFTSQSPVQFVAEFLTEPATVTDASGTSVDYAGGRSRGGLTLAWVNERWQMADLVLDIKQPAPR